MKEQKQYFISLYVAYVQKDGASKEHRQQQKSTEAQLQREKMEKPIELQKKKQMQERRTTQILKLKEYYTT